MSDTTDTLYADLKVAINAYVDGMIAEATAPLNSQVSSLQSELQAASAQITQLQQELEDCKGGDTGGGDSGGGEDPVTTSLKPRVGGLVVTNPTKLKNYNGVIKHAMDKAHTWADLEPSQGQYNFKPIHDVLNALPKGAYLKVVVDSGTHAPEWVKAWGSVDVVLSRAGTHGSVPFFWTDKYVQAWCAFQSAMANEFDGDPRLKQVVYTGTMTENSEPFTLGGDTDSGKRLYAAGFRWELEKSTMATMLEHMLSVWSRTRVEFALHGAWQYATASGISRGSWTDIKNFVDPFVQKHGGHLITANYGLGPDDGPPDPMYVYMASRGPDSGYQLTVGSPYNDDTRAKSVQNGIKMGGCYVEHAAFSDGNGMTLQQMEDALEANAAK